ncbi:hypothetical protein Vi05172_g11834 [Venturia inaequalis]|nr:hypothetical protein Vi05172_g11834 [Venturia inaequalis]
MSLSTSRKVVTILERLLRPIATTTFREKYSPIKFRRNFNST